MYVWLIKEETDMSRIILIISSFFILNTSVNARELNIENVYQCIMENRILQPKYVLAQSCLETGWLKSYNCMRRNNLFGFRSSIWITDGNKMGYKVFDSWEASVEFYKGWQVWKGYTEGESYIRFLKRVGYAEDPKYGAKVTSVLVILKDKYGIE